MNVIIFGSSSGIGSCKLCKIEECRSSCDPEKGRIPIEATGINVVETCKKFGLRLKCPAVGNFWRIGLILVI